MISIPSQSSKPSFKPKKKGIYSIIFCLFLSILLTGCQSLNKKTNNDPIQKSSFILNTVVRVTLYDSQDESIIDGAFDLCRSYEQLLSRTIDSSEISKLNAATSFPYTVSDDTAELIAAGLYYSKLSHGAFDITIAPISSLWDFTSGAKVLPDQSFIDAALPLVNYKNVSQEGNQISFSDSDMALDLGAIAKGYIADQMKTYLLEQGVKSAIINLGGNVLCVGEKPDSSAFTIGIQKPFEDRNETIAVMEIRDKSVVSSGVYERHFVLDGKNYHHILNPATGYPYDNGLTSVTIISDKSVDGDALSTTCFSLGLEEGLKLINSLKDTYAVFITSDYELHYSDGFEDAIVMQK